MHLTMHPKAKTVQITDETSDYLDKKLEKLGRHFHYEPEASFAQGFERGLHIVELTLHGDGLLIRGQVRHSDLRVAIDGALTKLETQLRRYKDKRVTSHRQPSPIKADAEHANAEPEAFEPRIVRRKSFPMKSMTAEDAARQMELLGHTFFVFLEEETGRVAVLYRRENDDYGLIESNV